MLVRDRGDSWQLVLQPDHADLSGQFARRWGGGGFAPPDPRRLLELAATRHDDGWGVWDRRPGYDLERDRPRNFLDVPVPVHLAFYRACIAAATEEDPYAGMLISMHGAGIYTGRYGTQPSLGLTQQEEHKEEVEAFVQEQEAHYRALAERLGVGDDERWTNYKLLQIYDRLSLYFCLRDAERGEADTIEPVPVDYGGNDVAVRLEPVGPWRVRIDPFPFEETPARFTLVRRVLGKRSWADHESFRRDFSAAQAEELSITIEAA